MEIMPLNYEIMRLNILNKSMLNKILGYLCS